MFQEVLKEFVPGKMIEFKDMSADNNHELKLNCLEGVIKYLNYKRFGHMNVNIMNEVPLVPYSIWGEKYNGIKEELLETSEKAERKETESLQSQYPQKNRDCPVGAAGSELPVCRL